jgi:hypothetical protein
MSKIAKHGYTTAPYVYEYAYCESCGTSSNFSEEDILYVIKFGEYGVDHLIMASCLDCGKFMKLNSIPDTVNTRIKKNTKNFRILHCKTPMTLDRFSMTRGQVRCCFITNNYWSYKINCVDCKKSIYVSAHRFNHLPLLFKECLCLVSNVSDTSRPQPASSSYSPL